MSETGSRPQRTRNSVATKIIFVVFLSTTLTALIVSWISVHSTYSFLHRKINQSYPALLSHAADRLVAWLGAGKEELASLAREPSLARAVQRPRGDAGRSIVAPALRRLGVAGIDVLVLSHLHPDHIGDLVPFLFASHYSLGYTRTEPFWLLAARGFHDAAERLDGPRQAELPENELAEVNKTSQRVGQVIVDTSHENMVSPFILDYLEAELAKGG